MAKSVTFLRILLLGGLLSGSLSVAAPTIVPKVLLVVIDGVRDLEIQGKAMDDFGKPVPMKDIFPQLSQLKKEGLFLPNMAISNRYGVSLPAYADIFTGARQQSIQGNDYAPSDIKAMSPTLFEELHTQLKLPNSEIMVLGSWEKICAIATPTTENREKEIFKSCGWEKGKFFKPSVFDDSRTDADTFLEASKLLKEKHPRLVFLHLGDADEEAHLHKMVKKKAGVEYGIHHYHAALRAADYYVGRLWKQLSEDEFYKGSTTLFVTTDHGRDDQNKDWSDHGKCLVCSGYQKIFGLILGPGVSPQIINKEYQHVDIAPTLARVFGIQMPSATGKAIKEVFSSRGLASK